MAADRTGNRARSGRRAREKEQVVFTEPFDGASSPKGWSWLREDPKAWRLEKNALVIKTSTGSLWQQQNNNRNILLRALPDAKDQRVAVEALVENEPTNEFEHAGLVWYCDDDNYVALLREKLGAKVEVQLVSETNGKPKVGFAQKPFEPKNGLAAHGVVGRQGERALPLRPRRTIGRCWWQCDLPVKGQPSVGLITGYAPAKSDHESRFRQFRILAAAQ